MTEEKKDVKQPLLTREEALGVAAFGVIFVAAFGLGVLIERAKGTEARRSVLSGSTGES